MQIDSMIYRLSDLLNTPVRWRNIVLSKIWYRHVITMRHAQLGDLRHDQIRLWIYERPQESVSWESIDAAEGIKIHIAFRRHEDSVMFKLKAM